MRWRNVRELGPDATLTISPPNIHRFASDFMDLTIPPLWHVPSNCVSHPLSLCTPREASPELALAG